MKNLFSVLAKFFIRLFFHLGMFAYTFGVKPLFWLLKKLIVITLNVAVKLLTLTILWVESEREDVIRIITDEEIHNEPVFLGEKPLVAKVVPMRENVMR